MELTNMMEYTESTKELINKILDDGFRLTSDVFEEPVYVEIATYDYDGKIYYFRIVTGKVVSFRELTR